MDTKYSTFLLGFADMPFATGFSRTSSLSCGGGGGGGGGDSEDGADGDGGREFQGAAPRISENMYTRRKSHAAISSFLHIVFIRMLLEPDLCFVFCFCCF